MNESIKGTLERDRTFTCTINTEKMLEPVGKLHITDNFGVVIYNKMPSRFHQWMAKILLGWKYEENEP